MTALVIGAGGGGKGGGGSARVAQEAPDSLRSKAYARVMDLISEGEIEGLVDGLKSVYLDDTPIQNADGSYNFTGVTLETRPGTQQQGYVPGFASVENEVAVGVEVKASQAVVRSITDPDVDAVRVKISVPQLTNQDTTNGDLNGSAVTFAIDRQVNGGGFVEVVSDTISGKTTTRYQRSYYVPLTGSGPWEIRVRRITADSTSSAIQNKTFLESYTEVIESKLRYPNSALVALRVDASQFSSIPRRSYDMKLLRVRVPTNYEPTTRAYSGIWDGTFKIAWTDNPAWCFYDLVTSTRYGLGSYIPEAQVDKWALYRVAQYCDQLVPNGLGGFEPRFTCNLYLQTREQAYKVVQDMASIFRGMVYWSGGAITVTQDAPVDPVYQFAPANVVDGEFAYQGSSAKARHTVALVIWNDPEDFYRQKVEYVEDATGIARYGIVQTEVVALGCTSRGQAHRVGKWLLYSEQSESEIVTFRTGLEGAVVRPGDVIKVADPVRGGMRLGGRIAAATTGSVTLDQDVPTGSSWRLSVITPGGQVEERAVFSVSGRIVSLTSALSAAPQVGAIWVLAASNVEPQLFRVVSVAETDPGVHEVTALAHNPSKYGAIEQGLKLQVRDITVLDEAPPAPASVSMSEALYRYQAEVRVMLSASWSPVERAVRYVVDLQKDGGNFERYYTQNTDFEWRNVTPGNYVVRVYAVGATGKASPGYAQNSLNVLGKTAPPADVTGLIQQTDPSFGATLYWNGVADLDLFAYEVREGASWGSSTLVGQAKATVFKIGLTGSGSKTYLVKALDSTGNYSTNAASVTVTINAPAAPAFLSQIVGNNIVLNWTAPSATMQIVEYELRYGSTWASATAIGRIKGTAYTLKAEFVGSRTFWVAAIDIEGRVGTPGQVAVQINAPTAVVVQQQVIDNNVLLRWSEPTATLPISHYELRKGASFESGSLIGTLSARFSVVFESVSGQYTYWVAAVDSAGNVGTASQVLANVNQPPDYTLQLNMDSTFSGTRYNMVVENGKALAPVNASETWQSHFTSRGWNSPQDQINAGLQLYIQPGATSGFYEEVIDYGATLPGTRVMVTLTQENVSGIQPAVTPTISVRNSTGDAWTNYPGVWEVYSTNFRYIKVRLDVAGDGFDDIARFVSLNVRLDSKLKNDAGAGYANAGDAGGTAVPFNMPFLDVHSISVSPKGTAPRVALYDFVDAPHPTTFKVLLFDMAGNRVSGDFSWAAKGV